MAEYHYYWHYCQNKKSTHTLCKDLVQGEVKPANDIQEEHPEAEAEVEGGLHHGDLCHDQDRVPEVAAKLASHS